MKLSDEKRIEAPRAQVWRGLNDTDILQKSIPGCESLERVSDTEFNAEVSAKVGPVKAKFKGNVHLSELNPPESYRISGEGKGGAAGFAKGGARIKLTEDGDATILSYEVDADVGGKLAQIGGRLLEGTSKKLAAEFFNNFEAALNAAGSATGAAPESSDEADAAAELVPPTTATGGGAGRIWLIVGVVFLVGALALTLFR